MELNWDNDEGNIGIITEERMKENSGELDQTRMDISMTRAMNRMKVSQR